MPQVDKDHYFEGYDIPGRWGSYYHQIESILSTDAEEILEIGIGNKTVYDYISRRRQVRGMDFAEDLDPDKVGDIRDMPFEDDSFDLVCAFEVLEHIPKKDLDKALKEMKRVSREHVLVSVPQHARYIALKGRMPLIGKFSFRLRLPKGKENSQFDGQHYWELNSDKMSFKEFEEKLEKYFKIEKQSVTETNTNHRFYLLKSSFVPKNRS